MILLDDMTIKRAVRGDEEASQTVLLACQNPVYNIALRTLGHPEDAQDAAQEALLKIYRHMRSFQGKSAFSSWVYRITVNACLDYARKQKQSRYVSWDEDALTQIPDLSENIEAKMLCSSQADEVIQALQCIDEHHRITLVLLEYRGLSYAEIAQVLGVNLGTVKSRISRARAALKKEFLRREQQAEAPRPMERA